MAGKGKRGIGPEMELIKKGKMPKTKHKRARK